MNNIDKTTCWYGGKDFYDKMIESIKSHLPLNEIGHGKILIELLKDINKEEYNLLDLGCGGGLIHTIIKGKYTGSDMEHVIENVSKVNFPDLKFISCDIVEWSDLSFINSFDIIILNAVIDVMEYPLSILDKILKQSKNYVIIHRQEISNKYLSNGFTLLKSESYGGFTYRTILERKAFDKILKENNFSILKETNSGLEIYNNKSFLLKKNA